ncbi:MAG: hypothetical protein WA118_08310 [Carboxydocellales bacterium]
MSVYKLKCSCGKEVVCNREPDAGAKISCSHCGTIIEHKPEGSSATKAEKGAAN